jgi:hypothetical protein
MTLRCRENPPSEPLSRLGQMPRLPASLLALVLSAVTVLALGSCGGEDAKLLPGETAREITANLDTVQQLAGEGDCLGAESAAQQVSEQIEELGGVDRKLKQALEEGAARLNEVIAGCEESSTEAIAPAIVPTEPESNEEKASKDEEKEAKGREKEEEKEAKQEEKVPPATAGTPSLPPQAKGEAKGHEAPPPAAEEGSEESPSGGLGAGSPAGEG